MMTILLKFLSFGSGNFFFKNTSCRLSFNFINVLRTNVVSAGRKAAETTFVRKICM